MTTRPSVKSRPPTQVSKQQVREQLLLRARGRRDAILSRLRAAKDAGEAPRLKEMIHEEVCMLMRQEPAPSLELAADSDGGDTAMVSSQQFWEWGSATSSRMPPDAKEAFGGLMTDDEIDDLVASMEAAIQEELQEQESALLELYEGAAAAEAEALSLAAETALAWEGAAPDAVSVLCPICQRRPLRQAHGVIVCVCGGFRLDGRAEGVGLSALQAALAGAWADHAGSGCAAPLRFALERRFSVDGLFAYCEACQHFAMVA